jgi:hypothetical protein
MQYMDGELRPENTISGVTADELNYSPYVAPGYVAVAWVMLTDATAHSYSQYGWLEYSGNVRHMFSQVGNSSTGYAYTQLYTAQPINSLSSVEVSWVSGASHPYRYYLGGVLQGQDTYSFTPGESQISGETISTATQMPGGHETTHYQYWSNERIWYPSTPGGNWHYFNENWNTAVAFNTNTVDFGQSNYPSPYLDSQFIWDWSCLT